MIFPFPYRVIGSWNIQDGTIFKAPLFCRNHISLEQCNAFYATLDEENSLVQCPFGFGVYHYVSELTDCIICGLNIEGIGKSKFVKKQIKTIEFIPRIPKACLINTVNAMQNLESNSITDINLKSRFETLKQDEILLNDTIHEIRKLNNQIKSSSIQLHTALQTLKNASTKEIEEVRKNIEANTQLLSIRLNAYDMISNPDTGNTGIKIPIPVFRKFEKVYKCLYANRIAKKVNVHMSCTTKEESTFIYRAKDILELGFFIIIENAIKYSPEGESVNIYFDEYEDHLTVKVINWGIKPQDYELSHLTERGFRAKMVVNKGDTEGNGLGLYLLNNICIDNGIKLTISLGSESRSNNGWIYKPFIITLRFDKT